MTELARLQDIADLHASLEFAKHAPTVDKPPAWKARVASDFLKEHRGQVLEYLRKYPDANDDTVLKSFRNGTKKLQNNQIPSGQHPLRDCSKCDGTGWYYPDPAVNSVKRCTCFDYRLPVWEQQPRFEYVKTSGTHYERRPL